MFDPMKGFLNLPMWARLAIALTIAVGMFLFIGIQAEKQYDREDPFMVVCWDAEGAAHYPDEAEKTTSCPSGEQLLQWNKKTKTVLWDFDSEFDVYLESHSMAIERTNEDLGLDALAMTTSGPADITIVHGSANSNGIMSTSHYRSSDGTITAIIRVKKPGDTRAWMLEERHELLHALGIAHKSSGIMRKTLEEPEDRQLSWLLRPNDRKALRKLLLVQ